MTSWLTSCNPDIYNIKEAFKNLKEVDWRQHTNVEVGDSIYIYISKPVQAVAYKCIVLEVNKPQEDQSDKFYRLKESTLKNHDRYMRLRLEKTFNPPIPKVILTSNYQEEGTLNGFGGRIGKIGIYIPENTETFAEFCSSMTDIEIRFQQYIESLLMEK